MSHSSGKWRDSRTMAALSFTLEGHSDKEVEEKREDGQENGRTKKRRRRISPFPLLALVKPKALTQGI